MKPHRYRIRIEEVPPSGSEESAGSVSPSDTLSFEVNQHDDLLGIVARVRTAAAFPDADAAALAVGLKLFTGVMLLHRKDPLFADVQPVLRAFIGNLKARVASTTPPQPPRSA